MLIAQVDNRNNAVPEPYPLMPHILILITAILSGAAIADQSVIKSPVDQKQYRYLQLDNRLKVLLISDSETDKSAASLDVYVGSGSDPHEWNGIAHFLEHMLFLGTKKFPEAGEYQEFIRRNGGSDNAYTSFNHTNYYFSIGTAHFEPALERFSRFFIDPTFDPLYVDRERSVVHSEYQARKKDESRRIQDAQKLWLNAAHPASRFAVGSLETLRDRDEASAREKLIEFYNQHYSANIMSLAVLGKEPLEQLETWVTERFSAIPDGDVPAQKITRPYFNRSLMPVRLNTVPEKQQNTLGFIFPIPSTHAEYKSKPLSYIANLLGHEGEGSLFSLLKQKGWVERLSAGIGFMDQVHGEFRVQAQLTQAGLQHIEDIGAMLFQAIALIRQKGIEKWRYDEQSNLSGISFRFAQQADPGRLVQSLASRLQVYPAADVLQGPYAMETFNPDRIAALLDFLRADNVNIHVTSQLAVTDKVTDYYDVDYSLVPIDPATIERWKEAGGHVESGELQLPTANTFIPERLALLDLTAEARPVKVSGDADIAVWYRPDNQFGTPRANFYFNIMSPAVGNVRNIVLTVLYVRLVNSQLNKTVYPAHLADLNYSLYRHARGISGRISGFEDRQSELLKLIVAALASPDYDQARFDIVKAGFVRELRNVSKDSPSNQVVHEIYRLLMLPYWTEEEKIAAVEAVGMDDVAEFAGRVFQQVKVNVLSHGDVSLDATLERVDMLNQLLRNSEFVAHVDKPAIRSLRKRVRYLRSMELDHSDSALAVYFQGNNNSITARAKVALLKHLLESPFYHQLRTINRVGYLVHSGTINIDDTPGLLFSVQSHSHSPPQIRALYDQFINQFGGTLDAMGEQQFEQLRTGLVTRILRRDKKLDERTRRYWRELDQAQYEFDSQQQFADAVSALSLNVMQHYFRENIVTPGQELWVQSPGIRAGARLDSIDAAAFVQTGDVAKFRQN